MPGATGDRSGQGAARPRPARRWALPCLLAAGLLAACASPAGPPPAPPGPGGGAVMRRSTTMGAGTRVASYARTDERCQAAALPEATVTREPPHGTLTVRPAEIIMGGRLFSGITSCRDKLIRGIELWYAPDPGFRGTDPMAWRVDDGSGPLDFRATVDVR